MFDSTLSFGIVTFIVLNPYVWFYEEYAHLKFEFWFITQVIISSVICVLHTYTTLMTLNLVGPIGVNIAGICKDIILTYVGFMFFDDAMPNPLVVFGLLVSFSGASFYIYAKATEKIKQN